MITNLLDRTEGGGNRMCWSNENSILSIQMEPTISEKNIIFETKLNKE